MDWRGCGGFEGINAVKLFSDKSSDGWPYNTGVNKNNLVCHDCPNRVPLLFVHEHRYSIIAKL